MGAGASMDVPPEADEKELHEVLKNKYAALKVNDAEGKLPADLPGKTLKEALEFKVEDDADELLIQTVDVLAGTLAEKLKEFQVPEIETPIRTMLDSLETAVYQYERWPILVDPSGQGTRFMHYQRGTVLLAENPLEMQPESLRKSLVGALANGSYLIINFDEFDKVDLETYFEQDHFPREIVKKIDLFQEAIYSKLLRPDQGDPAVELFQPKDDFKFVIITKHMEKARELAAKHHFAIVSVLDPNDPKASTKSRKDAGADEIAAAFGARDVKRNSSKLVEAAFDGDWDVIQDEIDKGYSPESEDPHGHTALSEAACQGHLEICKKLLDLGCDPNTQNDLGRTPLYRASYNGHLEMVQFLLDHGADPRLTAELEAPYDVAKTDEVRQVLQDWDPALTDKLIKKRKEEEARRTEERLTTAAERDAFAREKIRQELISLAMEGKTRDLEQRLQELADEAITHNERPRGCAEVRDERGNTLLLIATWKGHTEMVEFLLQKYKEFDPEFDKVERKVFFSSTRAREAKGWNACSLATFHGHKKILQVLLENECDPYMKNSYNKNSFDLAQDDLDACRKVLVDRSEIRSVLLEWEKKQNPRAAAEREKVKHEEQESKADPGDSETKTKKKTKDGKDGDKSGETQKKKKGTGAKTKGKKKTK